MWQFIALCSLAALTIAQDSRFGNNFFPSNHQNMLPCGFTCTRQARFTANIDNRMTTATCTANNVNPRDRCGGCCQARALAAGLRTIDAAGFPSTMGNDCVCCIYNSCMPRP